MVLNKQAQERLNIIQKTPLFKESLLIVLESLKTKAVNNLVHGDGDNIYRWQGYYKALTELEAMVNSNG